MNMATAIRALQYFASKYGHTPIAGKTTAKGAAHLFQRLLRVEFHADGYPIQAWINDESEKQSCAYHFTRGKNRISFGSREFNGNWNRVTTTPL